MTLVQRVSHFASNPTYEWQVIASEATTAADLFKKYIIPLSAIPALASFIGMTLVGVHLPFVGFIRISLVAGLANAAMGFILSLFCTYLTAWIINALAPSYGGKKNSLQALKVTAYSLTPMWLAGVLNAIPVLAFFSLVAALYSIYLLYLGLPILMSAPHRRAIGYTAASVICSLILILMVAVLATSITITSPLMPGVNSVSTLPSDLSPAKTAIMEPQQLAQHINEIVEKRAAKPATSENAYSEVFDGDDVEQAAPDEIAQRVDPVAVVEPDELKALFPEAISGLKRVASSSGKTADTNYPVSTAQAQYGDETNLVTITVSDYGSDIGGHVDWLEGKRESDYGGVIEKVGLVDGRQTYEQVLQSQGHAVGTYSVVVAGRFVVEVVSAGADATTAMKVAADPLLLSKLESLRREGAE